MNKRRTAAELIAFHLCWDVMDVMDCRYQPSRYRVAVYVIGDDYMCAPGSNQPLPKDFDWQPVGEYYGRTVYFSKMKETA